MMNIKAEHPRPDFKREQCQCLNGPWTFTFDDEERGLAERWYQTGFAGREIVVPFCYQSRLSGIEDKAYHPVMWYTRQVHIGEALMKKRVFLNFCAVDYKADVWVNGMHAASHEGGYTPFACDITDLLDGPDATITVRAEDRRDLTQPRGKQYFNDLPDRCWYTPCSGIWQTVWLEGRGSTYLDGLRIVTDIDRKTLQLSFAAEGAARGELALGVHIKLQCDIQKMLKEKNYASSAPYIAQGTVFETRQSVQHGQNTITIYLEEPDGIDEYHLWSPETPVLYDLELTLSSGDEVCDAVGSYFGMRKIECKNGMILLNNRPYYQKLILDQGYWEESLLTAPSDEALRADILHGKAMGFNGARRHQKIEEARFYYWADKLGYLVWGEMPSAYRFCAEEQNALMRDMTAFIGRDFNHPSIVAWVPLNESWGVRNIYKDRAQQSFAAALYYMIHALDGTRFVSTNDGWESPEETDIYGIHDYAAYGNELRHTYESAQQLMGSLASYRMLLADGAAYDAAKPILITEYGGIAFAADREGGNWGYNGAVADEAEFLRRFSDITAAFDALEYVQGYCYTQLTDVFQEVNGLMDMARRFKVAPEKIRAINDTMGRKRR